MKKLTPSFIAVTISALIYMPEILAGTLKDLKQFDVTTNQRCLVNVPVYNRPIVKDNINEQPVNISADEFDAQLQGEGVYHGNVSVTQGNRNVKADKITLTQTKDKQRHIDLDGNIDYEDNLLQVQGKQAAMNLNNKNIEIKNTQYHLVGRLGRGSADSMQYKDSRYIVLENGNFTSCPIDDSSWNIQGSKIIHDNEEQLLEVWDAVFKIGKVPVLYSPYLQLPTGNKRRSGLLMPSLSYNSIDGVDFSLPIYWNIAPNYDATFTPRGIQRRGVQMQAEMRYLNYLGLGTIGFDWLQYDRLYNKDRKKEHHRYDSSGYSKNDYRWLFHWQNDELITYNWRFFVDANRVSDNQYLTDLSSKYASETDGYLSQHYQLGYNNDNWDINLNYKYFQSLQDKLKNQLYRTEPQLNVNYYDHLGDFNFRTFGQASRFVTSGDKNPKTWRYHIEPNLNYNLMSSWASVSTGFGFMATHYNQDVPKSNSDKAYLKKDVNRFLPKFGIDGKVIFERDVDSFTGYTQTIEPRIKYLYIPYRDQSRIDNYDSSMLQSDYIGLFRDQPYSGLDRIASANKLASGLTTRFFDDNKVEKFNLSLGQVYYFTHTRTGDNSSPLDKNKDTGTLTWATDAFWLVNDKMIIRSGFQYDTRIDEMALANAIFEYRESDSKIVQLSYRYANKNYIDSIKYTDANSPYRQDISQLGTMSSWPITDTISAVGSIYYDLDNHQTADSFVGLHYSDCCWGVSIQYGRKITDWNSNSKTSKYKNKFSLNFELRGLSPNNNTIAKMLDFGLLHYKTAFEVN